MIADHSVCILDIYMYRLCGERLSQNKGGYTMPTLTNALESILADWRAQSARHKYLAQQAEAKGDKDISAYYQAKHSTTDDHIMRIAIALKEDTRP